MVNGGALEVGSGDSGLRLGGLGVRDPRGLLVFLGLVDGCTSPVLHARNRCLWTVRVGEVRGRLRPRAPRCWLCGRRVVERARIASALAGAARISLASRSAAPPTRLETRTKESNMRASRRVG